MSSHRRQSRSPPPRPVTPLRPSSRTSLRSSTNQNAQLAKESPLDSLEPQFAELSDSLVDLETNLLHLQLMHESLSRFSENFASFLYGLEMNAFVVDWPEQPLVESVERWKMRNKAEGDTTTLRTPTKSSTVTGHDIDNTLISDTTFASLRATPARRRTIAPEDQKMNTRGRGGMSAGRGVPKKSGLPARSGSSAGTVNRGARGARGSGLPTKGRGTSVK